jgi:hypothetical protein
MSTGPALAAPTTQLGERLGWTALLLAGVAGIYLLMWRGWRNRKARQGDVPALPELPADLGADVIPPVGGVYVSSTTAGDWLDRIAVRDLGVRSPAVVHVTRAGVSFDRTGASDVFVPAAYLRGVRREKGMAGKFLTGAGLVVVTWEHGDRMLDTGFRPDRARDSGALVAAIDDLVTEGSSA